MIMEILIEKKLKPNCKTCKINKTPISRGQNIAKTLQNDCKTLQNGGEMNSSNKVSTQVRTTV